MRIRARVCLCMRVCETEDKGMARERRSIKVKRNGTNRNETHGHLEFSYLNLFSTRCVTNGVHKVRKYIVSGLQDMATWLTVAALAGAYRGSARAVKVWELAPNPKAHPLYSRNHVKVFYYYSIWVVLQFPDFSTGTTDKNRN